MLRLPGQGRQNKRDWLIPVGLLALGAIPLLAGALRVVQLAAGAAITPDNARFAAAPIPVVLHILSALIFCVLGAFQFLPGLRSRRPHWHRMSGRLVVACGLIAAFWLVWLMVMLPALPAMLALPAETAPPVGKA